MKFFSGGGSAHDRRSGLERDQSCISTKCVERVEKALADSNVLSPEERATRDALKNAEVTSHRPLGSGKSGSLIVYLKNPQGGEPIKTLFKPYRGELQGRSSGEQSMAAELAMYITSQSLGLTAGTTGVIRELALGDQKITGYLQFFTVGTTFEAMTEEEIHSAYKKHERTLGDMALLDYIAGNSDRGIPWIEKGDKDNQRLNYGNFLVTGKGSGSETIVPLDGGDAFNYETDTDPEKREAYFSPLKVSDKFAESIKALNEDGAKFKALYSIVEELHGRDVADEFKRRVGKVYHALGPDEGGGYRVHLKKY